MKIPKDATIAPAALAPHLSGSQSRFLSPSGFTADTLTDAVRRLVSKQDARVESVTGEGVLYRVSGKLAGPKGPALAVVTVWLKRRSDSAYSFVRLEPDTEG